MNVRTVRHKGLRQMVQENDLKAIRPDMVSRLRNILSALLSAESMVDLNGPPGWRVHQLTGHRAGTWSISVTGNWRLTFLLDGLDLCDMDLEDYH